MTTIGNRTQTLRTLRLNQQPRSLETPLCIHFWVQAGPVPKWRPIFRGKVMGYWVAVVAEAAEVALKTRLSSPPHFAMHWSSVALHLRGRQSVLSAVAKGRCGTADRHHRFAADDSDCRPAQMKNQWNADVESQAGRRRQSGIGRKPCELCDKSVNPLHLNTETQRHRDLEYWGQPQPQKTLCAFVTPCLCVEPLT